MRLDHPRILPNVRVYGSGQEVVVLAHGFGLDQTSWRHVIPALGERYQVVAFDLVGFTAESHGHYDHLRYSELGAYADDLVEMLRCLGVQRCQYVGHSVSGMVGVLASIRAPELFDRLVLLGASPRYVNDGSYIGGFEQKDLAGLFDAMLASYSDWAKSFAPIAVSGSVADPAVEEFARGLLAMRPDVALSIAVTISAPICGESWLGLPFPA